MRFFPPPGLKAIIIIYLKKSPSLLLLTLAVRSQASTKCCTQKSAFQACSLLTEQSLASWGLFFLCFLNEKVCQRLLAPRVSSFLAVFSLNQLCFLRSLSHFPFTVWDTSNQPLLGWLFYVHTDFFFLYHFYS